MNVNAKAKVTITPHLKFGLFGKGGGIINAEAGVHAVLVLTGEMAVRARFGVGALSDAVAGFDAVALTDSCSISDPSCCKPPGHGLPVCINADVCKVGHLIQMDFKASAAASFYLKLFAQADFGFWDKSFELYRYFTRDGIVESATPFFEKELYLATMCLLPAAVTKEEIAEYHMKMKVSAARHKARLAEHVAEELEVCVRHCHTQCCPPQRIGSGASLSASCISPLVSQEDAREAHEKASTLRREAERLASVYEAERLAGVYGGMSRAIA